MAKGKTDRRSQRTRQALLQAFIELILTRGYEAVTTIQISEKANVGRSTFYLHYAGKEDLLTESMKQPSSGLAACVSGTVTAQQLTLLLTHFYEQRSVNRAFFAHPIRSLWVKSLAALIEPRLPPLARGAGSRPPVPRSLLALVVAEMQIALVTHWLTGGFPLKPEVVAAALVANTRSLVPGIPAA